MRKKKRDIIDELYMYKERERVSTKLFEKEGELNNKMTIEMKGVVCCIFFFYSMIDFYLLARFLSTETKCQFHKPLRTDTIYIYLATLSSSKTFLINSSTSVTLIIAI